MMYVYVFVGTLVLAEITMMLLAMVKPEIFERKRTMADNPNVAAVQKPVHDATHALLPDSASAAEKTAVNPDGKNDESFALTQKSDSIDMLLSELEVSKKRIAELDSKSRPAMTPTAMNDSAKTKDRKMLVKMLEAMSPENAARIVESFQDPDAKAILMGIKARQAGKILSAMNVERASKLMR
jgi:flagellar motility protein MotE (MotC chaperone)